MKLLKKENWWIWLILFIFSDATSTIVLGALLDVFDKKAWYTKWYIWIIGLVLIIPISVMIVVFNIEITSKTASKLGVKGSEYYLSPYIWIILLITIRKKNFSLQRKMTTIMTKNWKPSL